jgi:hypothetical protein
VGNPLPASLAPGAEATVSIGFKPSSIGSRNAYLRIASNDADEQLFDIPITGKGVAMPEISVESSDSVPLIAGTAMPFSNVNLGQAQVSRSFTIRNTGNAVLEDLSLKLVGSHTADFKVTSLTSSALAPGAAHTFTLSFHPSSGGTRSATLYITSNDEDESNFSLAVYGTGVSSAEISVEKTDGVPILNETGILGFGAHEIGGSGVIQSITIRNTGSGLLNLGSVTAVGSHHQDFSFSQLPPTLGPRTSVALNITFKPSASGTRSASIRIANNDPDESPFEIAMAGTGIPGPEIAVGTINTPDLRSGQAEVAYAAVKLASGGAMQSFTIRNQGSADLTGLLPVVIGTNASDFIVTQRPPSTITPGDMATFEVTFNPASQGSKAAVLRIASNDSDENPFVIDLTGDALSLPAIHVARSDAGLEMANLRTHAFGEVGVRKLSPPVTYLISNRGTANLTNLSVQMIGPNATDFIATPLTTTTLAPGTSTSFTATFLPQAGGNRQATLRILSNDPIENPLLIPISGIGTTSPEITLLTRNGSELPHAQGDLEFGDIPAGSAGVTKSIIIRNIGTEPLTGIKLEPLAQDSSGFFVFPLAKSILVPTESTVIQIKFSPKFSGSQSIAFRITSSDSDENPYTINLSGTGTALPAMVIKRDPRTVMQSGVGSLSFGTVATGARNSFESMTLSNEGEAPLTITSATLVGEDPADFKIGKFQVGDLAPDALRNLPVSFEPKSPGNKSAMLRIVSNDPDRPLFVIALTGSATGQPRIEVLSGKTLLNQSASVAFAPSSSKIFTIANRGNAQLTGISVQTSSGRFSDFSISPLRTRSLAPGKSVSFMVTFRPTSGGADNEQLRITSSDPRTRELKIVLTGSAKKPKSRRIPNSEVVGIQSTTPVAEKVLVSTVMIDGKKYRCISIDRVSRPEVTPGAVEVSPDLVEWASGAKHTSVMVNSPTLLKVRDNTPITTGSKRFIRIRETR